MLFEIISTWKHQPELSQAALLERFRGQEQEQQLQKLMAWNPPELEQAEQALMDALAWIERKTVDIRVQELIDKESIEGLSEAERQELNKNLLQLKAS